MNHKRGRPKSRRAGCLMCKPHKAGICNDETRVYHKGFGKIRKLAAAKADMTEGE